MAMPADPNDRSLLSSVFISADEEAYGNARDLWAMTGLPEPQGDEFFSGNHADRVYLTEHALCFSVVYRRPNVLKAISEKIFGAPHPMNAPVFEARRLVDDRILQPLVQVDLGKNACFEILPGVSRIGANRETIKSLAKELRGNNIHFYAPEPEYVGQVRVPGEKTPFDLIVNRRSIKPIGKDAVAPESPAASLQDSVFGALREQFADAFARSSSAAFQQALKECARIAALPSSDSHKILHDHWNGEGPKTYRRKEIAKAAEHYALRMAG
jgi:hypothetical protein